MEVEPIVHLTEDLTIDEIIYTNPTFSIDENDLNTTGTEENTTLQDIHELKKIEPYEREDLLEPDAFSKLKSCMKKLTPDGMILKKIEKEGYGEIPAYDTSGVRYLIEYYYAAYTESNDLPFDVVIPRVNKPARVKIGSGSIIPGLEIALKSMKRCEKSSFLIDPYLAFRDGQPPRIPKQATILFVINLHNITIDNEEEDDRPPFNKLIQKVVRVCESGSRIKKSGNNNNAIKEYRKAEALLARIWYANEEEEQVGNQKFMTIYTNLAICYHDNKEYRKVCTMFNMAKRVSPHLAYGNVKLLYHFSKALRILGDYKEAKLQLQKALKIDSNHPTLKEELERVNKAASSARQTEKQLCQSMLGIGKKNSDSELLNENREFLVKMREVLKEFKQNPKQDMEFDISQWTEEEVECFETECRKEKVRMRKMGCKIILIPDIF